MEGHAQTGTEKKTAYLCSKVHEREEVPGDS